MNNANNNFFDIINLASLIIGLQNLSENREQSAHNDVQTANAEQAQFLIAELTRQFEYQNQQLHKILTLLEKLTNDEGVYDSDDK